MFFALCENTIYRWISLPYVSIYLTIRYYNNMKLIQDLRTTTIFEQKTDFTLNNANRIYFTGCKKHR